MGAIRNVLRAAPRRERFTRRRGCARIRAIATNRGRPRIMRSNWIHPWENFQGAPGARRTLIAEAEGVYFTDSDGNRLIARLSGAQADSGIFANGFT